MNISFDVTQKIDSDCKKFYEFSWLERGSKRTFIAYEDITVGKMMSCIDSFSNGLFRGEFDIQTRQVA